MTPVNVFCAVINLDAACTWILLFLQRDYMSKISHRCMLYFQIARSDRDPRRDGEVSIRCAFRLDRDAGQPRAALQKGHAAGTSGT